MSMDNPFALFGIAPTFEVDEQQLAETFRGLQRVVHPDRYANASDQERRQSVEQAAAVNDAYRTLRDPLRRARCLLALRGVDAREDGATLHDSTFLMEQMELRERLAEVQEAPDPLTSLAEVKSVLQQRRTALLSDVGALLRLDTSESLGQAAERIRQLRFFDRIAEDVIALEERHDRSLYGHVDYTKHT